MTPAKIPVLIVAVLTLAVSCSTEGLKTSETALDQYVVDIAQTSGQLASGTSFRIDGSSTDSTNTVNHHGKKGHGRHKGILDGLNLLAPTDELLAIIDAESASDIRGLRISHSGGATITHYNQAGETVELSLSNYKGPHGCSFSGKQYPELDSLLSTIARTEIDFGSGVTYTRDTIKITRSGKIVVDRTITDNTITEVTTFGNYIVNGTRIEGIKTRVSTYDSATGSGSSVTSVQDGKIIFDDGTTAVWTSVKSRVSDITLDSNGDVDSGSITTEVNTEVTGQDGTVIYSHKTTTPLIENIACEERRRGPVSGTLETIYRSDTVVVDYGDGTCTNKTVTITFNGVVTTKTIDG